MAITYEPIATTTLGSSAATITFSSISSAYTDLRLVLTALANSSTIGAYIIYNNDSGANYSWTNVRGNRSTANSTLTAPATQINIAHIASATTTIPAFYTADIFSYAGSTNKTCLSIASADQNSSGIVERTVGLWRNTAAINRLDIYTNAAANFGVGTTATLYGILKA
jgi:hypothetical protein